MLQKSPAFVLGLAMIFAGLMLFQQWMFPQRLNDSNPKESPTSVSMETPAEKPDDLATQDSVAGSSDAMQDSARELDNLNSIAESDAADRNATQQTGDTSAIDGPVIGQAAELENGQPAKTGAAQEKQQFFTLGSLAEDGSDRYLAVFSSRGASIERVELNARTKNGNYRYRDLDHFGGYAGKMDLTLAADGLLVNIVGSKTPADLAGIQVGDRIQAVDGEPLASAVEFSNILGKSKVGQILSLSVRRGIDEAATTLNLNLKLTDQPLELLRPEFDPEHPELRSPLSLILALRKPGSEAEWKLVDSEIGKENWDCREISIEGTTGLEFSRSISEDALKSLDLEGPLTLFKRYWLEPLTDATRFDSDSRSFHINFEIEVTSGSEKEQLLGWELDGPTGLPTEGWWYLNKIHGRSSAIGSIAGARDVVGSTSEVSYVFFGGPEIASNALKPAPEFQYLRRESDKPPEEWPTLNYVGVDSQYFNVSLLPKAVDSNSQQRFTGYSAMAAVASAGVPTKSSLRKLVDCTFILFEKFNLKSGQPYRQRFELFAGPKEKKLLETYGLEDNRTFGWFAWLSKFLCSLLGFFYWVTGGFSYGLAIIMLTVLVRLLMIPISRKAALNAQMMQLLAPEMKAIADKYKDDMEKRAAAQRELFSKHKYNPFGGCFLMFLQLPVFIGLYRGLSVDIALRDKSLLPGLSWCSNLAAPDQFLYWKDSMPAWLGGETGWLGPWLNILPIITIVLFFVQQKLFTPPATDDQQKFAQRMMTFMMVFMGFMFFKVPAGLCIYFITSSIWGIAERQLLPKPKISEDKINEIRGGADSSPGESPVIPSRIAKPAREGGGIAQNLMKRLKDQIEHGKHKPVEKPMDAETRKRLDKERKKRRRD